MPDNLQNKTSLLDDVRLSYERKMLYEAIGRYGLEPLLVNFEERELPSFRDHVLGTCLKLSAGMSPRLFTLLEQVRGELKYDEPLDLFVEADAEINAYAIHSCDSSPHIVTLTSSLIERMNDDELRFVIGHEIGHIHYQHYRARLIGKAIGDEDNMPRLLRHKLGIWSRLAELSADRAGFVAAGKDLQSVVSAFFKLSSGLGPEHLKFDISVFLQQLAELQQLDQRTLLCGFSHPITPIRVRALQMFKDAMENVGGRGEVDEQVVNLSKLMDYQPSEPFEIHGRDFLLAGGLLVGHADDDGISKEEQSMLVDMLLQFMADPEEEIARITTTEKAKQLMAGSAEWLKANAGEERFTLIRMLARIAAVDGKIHADEEKELERAADLLGVPWRVARRHVYEVLGGYLQERKSGQMSDPIRLQ